MSPTGWNVGPLYLVVDSGATVDLALTLPSNIIKGGTFGVSPSGSALPIGMTLSTLGILALGSATVGTFNGVVFTYTEPAS